MKGCSSLLVIVLLVTLVFPAPSVGFWSFIQKLKWYKYCWITNDPGLCDPKTNGVMHGIAGSGVETNLVEDEPEVITSTPCPTTIVETTTTEMVHTEPMVTTTEMVQMVPTEPLVNIIQEPETIEIIEV